MTRRLRIKLRPRGPGMPERTSRIWLYWPACAFRVRTRVRTKRVLDVFEELVLRLTSAGYRRPEEIAELSGMAVELVTVVIGQLAQRGLLEDRGPTDRAIAILREEEVEHEIESTLGWMLRCELSGQVMPLLCEGDLPTEEKRIGDSFELPAVARGTDAEPRRDFELALRRWREMLRMADASDRADEDFDAQFPLDLDESEPDAEAADRPAVRGDQLASGDARLGVELLPATPVTVLVRVLAYLPSYPCQGGAEGLLVRHPFGIPGGAWFLERLDPIFARADLDPRLLARARGAQQAREQSFTAKGISLADLPALGKERATRLLGDVEALAPDLAAPVARVGEALVVASKRTDQTPQLRSVTCTLLEAILDEWIRGWGEQRRRPKRAELASWIDSAAERLSLEDPPRSYYHASERDLQRAAKGKGNLRDQIVLILLDAAVAPAGSHPFALALRIDPTLVKRFEFIRRSRNRSTHHWRNKRPERQDASTAALIIEHVERTLVALFTGWREANQPTEESLELVF